MEENKNEMGGQQFSDEERTQLGEEIIKMLGERTPNPMEAFVLLQQISVFLWDQYKIDWHTQPGQIVAEERKQRYMDYMSALIDAKMTEYPEQSGPEQAC